MRRKKSALSPRLGRKDELKLPREFLQEFWTILTHEQGDMGWTQAVLTFLGMLQKKGTKTSTGANMRDIQVLYTSESKQERRYLQPSILIMPPTRGDGVRAHRCAQEPLPHTSV